MHQDILTRAVIGHFAQGNLRDLMDFRNRRKK